MRGMFTRHAILRLLGKGDVRSGADIAGRLGISRAAVCKAVGALVDAGVGSRARAGAAIA
jgi:biotin operon repressor